MKMRVTMKMKLMTVTWVQLLLLFFIIGAVNSDNNTSLLKTVYQWKYFDYVWKSSEQRKWFEITKQYVPLSHSPIDVDRAPDGRTFVTIIRTAGVPATLNTVSKKHNDSGPLLEPYPSWSWYTNTEPCHGLINVYRVAIDKCNRLWVLDTGSIDFVPICPARLLVFDLNTDSLIFWQTLKNEIAYSSKGPGLLVTPIVDTEGPQCEDTSVYIADVQGHGLIVWHNYITKRLENDQVFSPQTSHARFYIANESFYLADGILGMALSPKFTNGLRYLVFRPMASLSIHAADTRELKNSVRGGKVDYITAKDVMPSQASAMAFASDGTMFYGLTEQIAIGCWNIRYPMLPQNYKIAITDPERLQFASGVKVFKDPVKPQDEYLLIMTNRLQKIYNRSLDLKEYNFRVLLAPVNEIVSRAGCDKGQ